MRTAWGIAVALLALVAVPAVAQEQVTPTQPTPPPTTGQETDVNIRNEPAQGGGPVFFGMDMVTLLIVLVIVAVLIVAIAAAAGGRWHH